MPVAISVPMLVPEGRSDPVVEASILHALKSAEMNLDQVTKNVRADIEKDKILLEIARELLGELRLQWQSAIARRNDPRA